MIWLRYLALCLSWSFHKIIEVEIICRWLGLSHNWRTFFRHSNIFKSRWVRSLKLRHGWVGTDTIVIAWYFTNCADDLLTALLWQRFLRIYWRHCIWSNHVHSRINWSRRCWCTCWGSCNVGWGSRRTGDWLGLDMRLYGLILGNDIQPTTTRLQLYFLLFTTTVHWTSFRLLDICARVLIFLVWFLYNFVQWV